jgi:predicted GNAT family acetyltransferase
MTVRHNAAAHRYELDTPHGMAIAAYRDQGESRVFTHTEVPSQDEGKGLGAALVRAALDDTKAQGLKIVPACSFVEVFVRRHPEYRTL